MSATRDLAWLNSLAPADAMAELLKCCGAKRWAETVAAARPFGTLEELLAKADEAWRALDRDDWLEAFRSHPKIGEKKAASTVSTQSQHWSAQEQAGVQRAAQDVTVELARLNREYEEKFGFIFIVCATGKSTGEILALLRERLPNEPAVELPIAAAEQGKITELRLRKLLSDS
jgi:OHCU decarboxylase